MSVSRASVTGDQQLDLTIFVGAFNEEKNIRSTVEKVVRTARNEELRFEVIVVNDGSSDGTRDICLALVEQFGSEIVVFVDNDVNIGLGSSFREILHRAKGESLVCIPGDDDIPENSMRLLFSNYGAAEMVTLFVLNREHRGWPRNIVSSLYIYAHMIFFSVYLLYVTGPGIYCVETLKTLDLRADRFSLWAEIQIKLWRRGVTLIELPTYVETGVEGSSAISLRNIWEALQTFFRMIWEVHFSKREFYKFQARRIEIEFATKIDGSATQDA